MTNRTFLGSIYKTTDGGATWSFAGSGLDRRDLRDLKVDPATGDVYATVAGRDNDQGVWRSQDGGASWQAVAPAFPEQATATRIALDNSGSNLRLHAGTSRSVLSIKLLPDADSDAVSDATEDSA